MPRYTVGRRVTAAKKSASLCGEMASKPIGALALIGLGYRSLSLSATAHGPVKLWVVILTAAALVFPRLFFPKVDPHIRQILSFLTFTAGFVARPLGGVIFGYLGDRLGRKSTLVITLFLMGVSTVLIGEEIGLEPIDDGEWDMHFGPIRLGRFDERTRRIEPAGRRQR